MTRTQITGDQIWDGTISSDDIGDGQVCRQDLNVTSTGKAVIRKVLPGDSIRIEYTGVDIGTGDVTIHFNSSTGGITQEQHRNLDQLVHQLAENFYYEVTWAGPRVIAEVWWTNMNKEKKIRSIDYVYSGNKISQSVTKQYDVNGNAVVGETLVETYYYCLLYTSPSPRDS